MRGIRRITFLVGLALAATSPMREGHARDRAAENAPATFSVTVTVKEGGIAAECESGCAWKKISASFPEGRYRITNRGVGRVAAPAADASFRADVFSIQLEPQSPGVKAACASGCNWKELRAAYPGEVYRITEAGVEAGGPSSSATREAPSAATPVSGRYTS